MMIFMRIDIIIIVQSIGRSRFLWSQIYATLQLCSFFRE